MITDRKYYCLVILILFLVSCAERSESYTGKLIELDFRDIEKIEDRAWVQVDGIRYTHYVEADSLIKDEFSLPASRTMYYKAEREGETIERFSPNSNFKIATMLGNFIDLNSSNNNGELARIKPEQRHLVFTHAILQIQRPDSGEFTVQTSPNYPVKITVKQ